MKWRGGVRDMMVSQKLVQNNEMKVVRCGSMESRCWSVL